MCVFQSLGSALEDWADVSFRQNLAIVSLICNVNKSSKIMEKVRLWTKKSIPLKSYLVSASFLPLLAYTLGD